MEEPKKQKDAEAGRFSFSRVQKAKMQFWLGLGGMVIIGLAIAVYFIFLKTPSNVQVAKGLDDPRCQTWQPGVCAKYSFGGFYFDPQSKACREFSGGSVCTQPPFVSQADCEAVCIRGEKDNAQIVDVNATATRDAFILDCTLPSGTFKVGDNTGAPPGSDNTPMGLGRCHVANADANAKHILLLWQTYINGKVWYATDMRFADAVTASFAKEVPIASGYDNGVFDYKATFSKAGDYKIVFSIFDCTDVEKKIKGSCSNADETKNSDIIAKVTPLQSIEKTFTVK